MRMLVDEQKSPMRVLSVMERSLFGLFPFSSNPGQKPFKSTLWAISASINRRFGTNFTKDNLYMTVGAAAAISIVFKALTVPGDEFIVFAPFFPEYACFIEKGAGAKCVIVPADTQNFQINFEEFEKRINEKTKGVVINSPNNPSGAVYSAETICRLAKILAEKEKEEFSTALIEGSVAILDKRNESLVATMTPDQEIVLSDGRLYKRTVEDIANRYRWTEGIIDCSGMSFDDLMSKFEKSFGIEIVNELDTLPQINIRRMKVNVKDGVSHALELLQRNAEFSYRYDDTTDTYYLYD